MAEELTTTLALPPVSDELVVLARDPAEMAEAQKGLIEWMTRKVEALGVELAEAEENLATAKRMKTRTDGWKRVVRLARKRVLYYEKARTALQEGYHIIPDLPVQVIAVRTSKARPPAKWAKSWANRDVKPEQLPEGDGRYVDSEPFTRERQDDDGNREIQATGFDEEVDFPFKVVKPQILLGMEAALKRKLFDEIGILPATRRGSDPILVGRITRREGSYQEVSMTFLIAWWIDTRSL